MTELQAIELDILKLFVEICGRLELRYYLVCGSALGAAKYRGFIPWDDDIDVGMPRPDYQKFLREAPALLPEHIFLQNYRTDPEFPHIFSKLRNSNTTFIEAGASHLDIHHGVFIDIFPLDGYPQGIFRGFWLEIRKKLCGWQQYCALDCPGPARVRIRNRIFRLLGYHKRTGKTLEKMERLFCRYPPDQSPVWCNHGNWQGRLEYAPRAQYAEGIPGEFEGLPVWLPKDCDAYLTQKYGVWQEYPPESERYGHHFHTVFSPNQPYTVFTGTFMRVNPPGEV